MINENELNKKLNEISQIVSLNYVNEPHVGVLDGVAGNALFLFYYAEYLNDDRYADIGMELISFCIDKINNGYNFPTYCNGIAGLGWTIQHLNNENFIDLDCDLLLSQFDEFLYSQMNFDLAEGNFDFLHGAIGYGYFFLKRFQSTNNMELKQLYRNYLSKIVEELNLLVVRDGAKYKWRFNSEFNNLNFKYDLGLSHGITSIINFLSRISDIETLKDLTINLIEGTVNFILSTKNLNNNPYSFYPNFVEDGVAPIYNSRLAWCYGDLGIGITLLRTSSCLQNSYLNKEAMKILNHSVFRREDTETMVIDSSLCHGAHGNAQIYIYLNSIVPNDKFKDSISYWINNGISRSFHIEGYAGYKHWSAVEGEWINKLSLLEGVSGIGLNIIDYLSKKPNTWDECLMIN